MQLFGYYKGQFQLKSAISVLLLLFLLLFFDGLRSWAYSITMPFDACTCTMSAVWVWFPTFYSCHLYNELISFLQVVVIVFIHSFLSVNVDGLVGWFIWKIRHHSSIHLIIYRLLSKWLWDNKNRARFVVDYYYIYILTITSLSLFKVE